MAKKGDSIGIIATVGTFDGVHRGHRFLLAKLKDSALSRNLMPAAIVLRTHPLRLVRPADAPPELSTFEERRALIEAMGIKVIPLEFDTATRTETSEQFMARIADEMGVKSLLIGHDNRFGSDRNSAFADYMATGNKLGIEVIEAPALTGISSSAVRKLLTAGKIAEGNHLLGRPYSIYGTVVGGAKLGRTIGFPTANLKPSIPERLIPLAGVYATRADIDETDHFLPAMTNIGHRPTVNDNNPDMSIETHIFNIDKNLYGKTLRLQFIDRLRPEQHFPSVEALSAQLKRDALVARQALGHHDLQEYTDTTLL